MQGVRLRVEEAAKWDLVTTFLTEQGFRNVNDRRRSFPFCGRVTYPLHAAVSTNDTSMTEVLLWAGADAGRENSDGLTPLELAYKLNRRGSHKKMIVLLSAGSVADDPI